MCQASSNGCCYRVLHMCMNSCTGYCAHMVLSCQGPPQRSKLKYLASRFLRRDIQGGAHDSVQDARAAMDLVLLKIRWAMNIKLTAVEWM